MLLNSGALARWLVAVALAAPLSTQAAGGVGAKAAPPGAASRHDAARSDPFTAGSPTLLSRAGYVSTGPFALGDDHDTRAVDAALGDARICWLETAHFRIGCALSPCAAPSGKDGDELEKELRALAQVLPKVDPKTRLLSTWLRTHVFAQRVEQLYAEFQRRLGVRDESFPRAAPDTVDDEYMGEGPYLGQRGKFIVLLFDRASSFGRYVKTYAGRDQGFAIRHHFVKEDALLFATSEEFAQGRFRDDRSMHCHVVFNVVHNLLAGYRHFSHPVPPWFAEGFAQWHVRRLVPGFTNYTTLDEFSLDGRFAPRWDRAVRGLVDTGSFTPAKNVLAWTDYASMKFSDRMTIWSRVDYLLSLGDERLRIFLDTCKRPFAAGVRFPSESELFVRQAEALRAAWDLDASLFDQRWSAWVMQRYAAR